MTTTEQKPLSRDQWKEIIEELQPLFKEARAKGLWFHTKYQDLWFSPDELQAEQASGKFIWGKDNWSLRNPQELIDAKHSEYMRAKKAYGELFEKVYPKV